MPLVHNTFSKQSHLSSIYKTLNKVNAATIKIAMAQGQKLVESLLGHFLSETTKRLEF
jgi:23S rRNA (adenine1618-N6)-methyltransferase